MTQSQADDCNKVISQERAAQVVLKDLDTAGPSAKLDDVNKLQGIAGEIAKTYAKESGAIKNGMQGGWGSPSLASQVPLPPAPTSSHRPLRS